MPRIFCSVSTCGHYKDNFCCISPVRVAGNRANSPQETCCDSYIDGRTHKDAQDPEMYTSIKCEAENCVFNSNRRCSAQSIDIAGGEVSDRSQTECDSFNS